MELNRKLEDFFPEIKVVRSRPLPRPTPNTQSSSDINILHVWLNLTIFSKIMIRRDCSDQLYELEWHFDQYAYI